MPGERHGVASFPGVVSVASCTYTISHGISPGVACLTFLPQADAPSASGPLVISDGPVTITIPDCKIDKVTSSWDGGGVIHHATILDRRWKWMACGHVSGVYNVPDPTGDVTRPPADSKPVLRPQTRFIPWTIRTIRQLMELCLVAMGETGYTLLLPPSPANSVDTFPPTNWDATNPAHALDQLANSIGCRIVYRLDSDSVLVCPVGEGGDLPAGSIAREGPGLDSPERPDSILLVGAPIRYQCRFLLVAVGDEWNGELRPIIDLSYAPARSSATASPWRFDGPPDYDNVVETDRLTYPQAKAKASSSVYKWYRLFNRSIDSSPFDVDDRDPKAALEVPGFGKIKRIQQVVLQDVMVEQAQPIKADEQIQGPDGYPYIQTYYDGVARDRPAAVFGSYAQDDYNHGVINNNQTGENTDDWTQVFVPFSIDANRQLVMFGDPVYELIATDNADLVLGRETGGMRASTLYLQTSCYVREEDTNQLRRYTKWLHFGTTQGTQPAIIRHDDCELLVLTQYDETGERAPSKPIATITNLDRVERQAAYYLAREAAKYEFKAALERSYNGLMPIWLDGKIQQVTWSVGESGAETQASLNTEHNYYIPTYPERLRIEYQAPAQREAEKGQPGSVSKTTSPGELMEP